MSPDGYLMPTVDATFDKAAALVLRECMALYDTAPPSVKSLLENVAITQRHIYVPHSTCNEIAKR